MVIDRVVYSGRHGEGGVDSPALRKLAECFHFAVALLFFHSFAP